MKKGISSIELQWWYVVRNADDTILAVYGSALEAEACLMADRLGKLGAVRVDSFFGPRPSVGQS